MNRKNEIWKDVPKYIGLYQASNWGRCRSLDRIDNRGQYRKGQILKPSVSHNGYHQICLYKNGNVEYYRLHHLILDTFIGECPEGMEGCHNDGNRLNNRSENLRWASRKENHADKKIHGTHQAGEKNPSVKLKNAQVLEILKYLESGVPKVKIAKMYEVSNTLIGYIHKGRNWKHIQLPEGEAA